MTADFQTGITYKKGLLDYAQLTQKLCISGIFQFLKRPATFLAWKYDLESRPGQFLTLSHFSHYKISYKNTLLPPVTERSNI